jgi:hypothetical protein
MKNPFILYQTYFVLNLLLLKVFIGFLVESIILGNYTNVIMCSFVIASDINDMINRQRNFDKYYPHFEHKWLYF